MCLRAVIAGLAYVDKDFVASRDFRRKYRVRDLEGEDRARKRPRQDSGPGEGKLESWAVGDSTVNLGSAFSDTTPACADALLAIDADCEAPSLGWWIVSLQGVNANGTLEALLPPLVPPPRNITRELHTSKSLIAGLAINGKEKFADDGETNVQDMAESDASRCILKIAERIKGAVFDLELDMYRVGPRSVETVVSRI